jgi:hypothetical protein
MRMHLLEIALWAASALVSTAALIGLFEKLAP